MDPLQQQKGAAAPTPPTSTPSVQITEDEKVRQSKTLIDQVAVRVLEQLEREGKKAVDPRKDPGFKAWQDTIKSPMGAQVVEGAAREGGQAPSSVTRAFVESEEFKLFSRHKQGQGLTFGVKGLFEGRRKSASLVGISDMRDVLTTMYDQQVIELPQRQLHVRDLMLVVPTDQNAIVFVRQTGFTNNAGMVPENADPATATSLGQSVITSAKDTSTIKRMGHWTPMPKEALDDMLSLPGLLESQLLGGMLNLEDAQILRGDNTGDNLEGVMVASGCQTHLWSAGDLGDTEADAILEGIVKVWIAELTPDGIVIHPTNVKNILKRKDSEGRYLFPQAHASSGLTHLWDLPLAKTTGQLVGTVSVGAFGSAATLYDRQEAGLRFAEQHASFAIQGMVAAIADQRVGLVNRRPEAFCKVTLDSAPA